MIDDLSAQNPASCINRLDIIRMAREAGLMGGPVYTQGIEKFAALIAAHEREECAKVCEEPGWNAANWCAKHIRARGEK
jgi:hypothetical protein